MVSMTRLVTHTQRDYWLLAPCAMRTTTEIKKYALAARWYARTRGFCWTYRFSENRQRHQVDDGIYQSWTWGLLHFTTFQKMLLYNLVVLINYARWMALPSFHVFPETRDLKHHISCKIESDIGNMEEDTEANIIQVSHKDEVKARIEVDAKDSAGVPQNLTLTCIHLILKNIQHGWTLSISSVEQ